MIKYNIKGISKPYESEDKEVIWVTFYYDLFREQVSALKVHENKEVALKHFNINCKNYFQLNSQFKADKLPATYGYPHRKYYGISATAFKKMFGISVDEALKQAESEDTL